MSEYWQKLKDPRWQKKRLRIMERDEFTCRCCGDSEKTLNVHHLFYFRGREPWEYSDRCLVTVCEDCHDKLDQISKCVLGVACWAFGFGLESLGYLFDKLTQADKIRESGDDFYLTVLSGDELGILRGELGDPTGRMVDVLLSLGVLPEAAGAAAEAIRQANPTYVRQKIERIGRPEAITEAK